MVKRFELTAEHVKLLRRMNVSWDDCEFGAPSIDPKRPYGNSSVARDVHDILGWAYPSSNEDDDYMGNDGHARAEQVHREMMTALQVVLATGSFEPGAYEADAYHENWRRAAPRADLVEVRPFPASTAWGVTVAGEYLDRVARSGTDAENKADAEKLADIIRRALAEKR